MKTSDSTLGRHWAL